MFPHFPPLSPCFPSLRRTNFIAWASLELSQSCRSPLGGPPHQVAIISVEVGGQILLAVHAAGLDGIREAQRPEGEILHGLLDQLDVTTSACGVCLDEEGGQNATSHYFCS